MVLAANVERDRAAVAEGRGRASGPPEKQVRRRSGRLRRNGVAFAWILFAPAIVLVAVITIAPIGNAIVYSLFDTSFAQLNSFVGLEHYKSLFTSAASLQSFAVTAIFAVASLAASLAVSLGLALLLNRSMRGITAFRTLLMLPWVTSTLLASLLWKWVISPLIGPFPVIVQALFGVKDFDPLSSGAGALVTLIFISVWRTFPFGMVLLLASLRSIPNEYMEASSIDGAGSWAQLRFITFPAVKNTLLVVTVYFSITFLTMAEVPLVVTGGGPAGATALAGLQLYQDAFQLLDTGSASALAVILFVINAILGIFYVRGLRSEDF